MNRLYTLILAFLVAFATFASLDNLLTADPVHAMNASGVQTYSSTISAETTVLQGATGTELCLVAADVTAVSTAGVWTFSDGTGGAAVWKVYLPADTPRSFFELFGEAGLQLSQNKLTATPPSASCTLALNARTRDQ